MRIVIGGASGLIGTALCRSLESEGHEVTRLVRRDTTDPLEVAWDPQNHKLDPAELSGAAAVVNLNGVGIGERRWTDKQKEKILVSRVTSTSTMARAVAACPDPKPVFVTSSAVGFYGSSGDEELTERAAMGRGFLARVCQAWEEAATPADQAGARTVVVRSGVVLTPHGGPLARQLLPFKLGLGGRVGTGEQWISWISLDDSVRVIRRAIEDPTLNGPVNSTAPVPVRQRDFATTLGEVLRRPAKLPTPVFALRAVFGSELVQNLLVEGQRVVPAVLTNSGFEFEHSTLDSALRDMLE